MIPDMVQLNGILLGILYALPVLAVFELWGRVWSRYAPDRAKRVYSKACWYYFYPFRWAIPDTIYKLWYQTGIMDEEAYRKWQRHGFIRDDMDPEYITRDTHE